MLTTVEGRLSQIAHQVSMNDATRVCGLLVKSSLLIPDPATMKERDTIADVDDRFENHSGWYVKASAAILAL